MKLPHEFTQLPITFDIEALQKEVTQFSENEWVAHHEGFKGNSAIPLLSVQGGQNNLFSGPIAPTVALKRSPYLQQVIASFNEIVGRSRLMRLEAGAEVPLHSDINYHWYDRVRIHIPIVTDEQVIFYCGDKQVHMAEGDAWIFDSWKNHRVVNASDKTRVHLVVDISGSSRFWNWVKQGINIDNLSPLGKALGEEFIQKVSQFPTLPFVEGAQRPIRCERVNTPVVMRPEEVNHMITELISEVKSVDGNEMSAIDTLSDLLASFYQDWRQIWSIYGEAQGGWDYYHQLRDSTFHRCRETAETLQLTNESPSTKMLIHCLIDPCFNPEVAQFNR
ncbi:aspartyl/asparaginyl beta-hydroxylase domain-containing protein [Psychrosphaera sp. B3R10]|uniref:aspartyl/asparaginyl beta-hydroxylase domain-containing protein n=1 Tax=unclassified Psychrosphaera TaxID=2641570 RepID=UPI001C0A491E|nr:MULTISPECIES: aspartyl/asparaginyl beta-hydroxylase domain-containing protein [unclassified Psychrosphaera]MBU2881399.1 aspartyl/asparaginyl beta-hydroxylase domain-containing protein [Psychrosphaera sp. I2R16]MBU2989589.1 aspartyl/asparaginyl beta-hydroxylase domain-containing protein [Psychrosphaera sp. B3R10]MDO6719307.1 aspartyl/asparaginyl beta-hydroxylase domain-containing protein [Psychrosphaera sp. 1_MG-2023]